jgi:hypothetical protein
VVPSVSGLTQIQVLFNPPISNGGFIIDKYLIEWNNNIAFTDVASYGATNETVANLLPALTKAFLGSFIYEISGLVTGQVMHFTFLRTFCFI